MQGPETRESLLNQLRDTRKQEVWTEFVQVYQPLIYNFAIARGVQHSDALDIVQEVLTAVANAIGRFQKQPGGSFRGYLFRITRNLVINRITRGKKHRGSGDSRIQALLNAQPDESCETSTQFDLQQKREVFRWAAQQIRERVKDVTWQAFWLTTMEGVSISEAASRLGKSNGAIRIARCRVTALLKDQVQQFQESENSNCSVSDSNEE